MEHSLKLCEYLSLHGYPRDLVRESLFKVSRMDRDNIIMGIIPLNPDLKKILDKYWPIMDRSSSTRSLLNTAYIVGFRRPKNLSDILTNSDIKTKTSDTFYPVCPLMGRCTHCPRVNKSGKIYSHSTGRKYLTLKKISCRSSNLIYYIQCKLCGIQYVGQTRNQLRNRMNNHISSIRTCSETPVAWHFNNAHNIKNKPPIVVTIVQLISTSKDRELFLRNKWENIWIGRLHTISPKGLNIQD